MDWPECELKRAQYWHSLWTEAIAGMVILTAEQVSCGVKGPQSRETGSAVICMDMHIEAEGMLISFLLSL